MTVLQVQITNIKCLYTMFPTTDGPKLHRKEEAEVDFRAIFKNNEIIECSMTLPFHMHTTTMDLANRICEIMTEIIPDEKN